MHALTQSKSQSQTFAPSPAKSIQPVPAQHANTRSAGRESANGLLGNQAMLRRVASARSTAGPIQFKLQIGSVNDPLEHEADRVADHVMRMPDPDSGPEMNLDIATPCSATACSAAKASSPKIHRKCAACQDEEAGTVHRKELPGLQRDAQSSAEYESEDAIDGVEHVLRTPGTSLDSSTRAYLEPRFGLSLKAVRIHTDDNAARSAHAVGARAYATGEHIVFGAGQYAPHTPQGRRLIAHELTHTIQQGAVSQSARPSAQQHTAQSQQPASSASSVQRMIQRVGECDGKSNRNCSGTCVPADGRGTGFCGWGGGRVDGVFRSMCICFRRDQPMLREALQFVFNMIIAALIAVGIVLTAAGIAAIIACLMGPCEVAGLILAIGAGAAAIVMGIIGSSGTTNSPSGPSASSDPSSPGGSGSSSPTASA